MSKVEKVNKGVEKEFEPLALLITIDNEKDLLEFWHRMNISQGSISQCYKDRHNVQLGNSELSWRVWQLLDKHKKGNE